MENWFHFSVVDVKNETTSYQSQNTDNNVTGYPGITSILEIKAEHIWTFDGATTQAENKKNIIVTYSNTGIKGATIKIRNQWGESNKTIDNLVEITSSTGINKLEENVNFAVYPNPFVEDVNFRFSEAGFYTLNILNTNDTSLQSNTLTTGAEQVTSVNVIGPKGLYIL